MLLGSPLYAQTQQQEQSPSEQQTQDATIGGEEQLEEDEEQVEDLIEQISPEEGAALQFEIGYRAYLQGDLDRALQRLRRALDLYEEHLPSQFWYGRLLKLKGRVDEAYSHFDQIDTGPYLPLVEQQRTNRSLLNQQLPDTPPTKWSWESTVDVSGFDRTRNLNPSSLLRRPGSGWYSTSYRLNRLVEYNDMGRPVGTVDGLHRPKAMAPHPDGGLVVAEFQRDRLQLVQDGQTKVLVEENDLLNGPRRLFRRKGSLLIFNAGSGRIVQLTSENDLVEVWSPESRWRMDYAVLGPEGDFWLYEARNHEFFQVSPNGRLIERHSVPGDRIHGIWVEDGRFYAGLDDQFGYYDPVQGELTPFDFDGRSIQPRDISDVLRTGRRLVLAQSSESAFYFLLADPAPDPDMVVQDGRVDFNDFPLIRVNLRFDDPLDARRFRGFKDQNVGVQVDGRRALPSLFKQRSAIYPPGYLLVVDPVMNRASFDESRNLLREIINQRPEQSEGAVLEVRGDDVLRNDEMHKSPAPIRQVLDQLEPRPADTGAQGQLVEVMDRAFDLSFRRRGSMGIVVASNRLRQDTDDLARLSRRAEQMGVPVTVVHPSSDSLPDTHPFRTSSMVNEITFGEFDPEAHWSHYREQTASDFTVIFRNPTEILRSGKVDTFRFQITYLTKSYMLPGLYIHP